jgi:hypothetical protein
MTVREIDVRITVAPRSPAKLYSLCIHQSASLRARHADSSVASISGSSVPVCGMLTTRGASPRRILNHCGALSSLTRSAPKLRRMVDNVRRCARAYEARAESG